ncbi:MAG TPA: hypothetical protein VL992_21530 [Tepidisphaeraceae bacterium]|nr:hypothetical protein [Tepidisphaeraceae bacterium]
MTLVATALCADRAVVSSASVIPQETGQSQTLVERLAARFRGAVRAVRLFASRCEKPRPVASVKAPVVAGAWVLASLSPFQFRLPPPLTLL